MSCARCVVLYSNLRFRFTGMIGLSGWSKLKRNQEKWKSMQRIATLNEIALKKGAPEVWKKQRDF